MTLRKTQKQLGVVIAGVMICFLSGCQNKAPLYRYCLEAKRTQMGIAGALTLTYVRKFEKIHWCEAEYERLAKQGFSGGCLKDEAKYDPLFEGKATGQWYLLEKVGRFSPAVIIYEMESELSDQIILYNLKQMAPHIIKFAALHRAPAEALIISPTGDIRAREKINEV